MEEENSITSLIFPQWIGRLSYTIRFVLCLGVSLIVNVLTSQKLINELVGIILLLVIGFYTILYVYAPRMRDAGMEKMWLILIPIANVFLILALFFVGEDGFDSLDG